MCELLSVNREEVLKLFNKTEESIKLDLQILREWLKYQPHLPNIDDARLERILLLRKFSIERAKTTIDAHFTVRDQVPEFFDNRDPMKEELRQAIRSVAWIPLKYRTEKLERVTITKLISTEPKELNCTEHLKYNFFIEDVLLQYDYSNGTHLIYDLAGCKLVHLTVFAPALLAKSLRVHMEAYGLRIAGIHILNPPPFIDTIVTLMKTFVKEKLLNRLQVHNDLDSLHAVISRKVLPIEYGGEYGNFLDIRDEWVKYIESLRSWFLIDMSTRVKEPLRPTDSKNGNILGSIHGTFKKLDID